MKSRSGAERTRPGRGGNAFSGGGTATWSWWDREQERRDRDLAMVGRRSGAERPRPGHDGIAIRSGRTATWPRWDRDQERRDRDWPRWDRDHQRRDRDLVMVGSRWGS